MDVPDKKTNMVEYVVMNSNREAILFSGAKIPCRYFIYDQRIKQYLKEIPREELVIYKWSPRKKDFVAQTGSWGTGPRKSSPWHPSNL